MSARPCDCPGPCHQAGHIFDPVEERRKLIASADPRFAPPYVYDDGGRAAAGYKGETGDCGVRAAAIVTGLSYQEVYDDLNAMGKAEKVRGKTKRSNSRTGISTKTLGRYLEARGFEWVPTMGIGTGCQVHLKSDELPGGTIVARVSRHYAAVIDGVVHDTHDSSRDGTRCVYGYWQRVSA